MREFQVGNLKFHCSQRFSAQRVRTARESSYILRDAAINGFGLWAGLGPGYYRGMFLLALDGSTRLGFERDGRFAAGDGGKNDCVENLEDLLADTEGDIKDSTDIDDVPGDAADAVTGKKKPADAVNSPESSEESAGAPSCGREKTGREKKDSTNESFRRGLPYSELRCLGRTFGHRRLVRLYLRQVVARLPGGEKVMETIGKIRDQALSDPQAAWAMVERHKRIGGLLEKVFWSKLQHYFALLVVGAVNIVGGGTGKVAAPPELVLKLLAVLVAVAVVAATALLSFAKFGGRGSTVYC